MKSEKYSFDDQERYLTYRQLQRGKERGSFLEKTIEEDGDISANISRREELMRELAETIDLNEDTSLDVEEDDYNEIENRMNILEKEMGGEDKLTGLRKEGHERLIFFMRQRRKIMAIIDKLEELKKELMSSIYANPNLREALRPWNEVKRSDDAIEMANKKLEALTRISPEAFLANGLLTLKKDKESFERHGIIETPHIAKQNSILLGDAIKKMEGTNGVVTLLGPTGSGKTVQAKRIAESLSTPSSKGVNYYFVSAHSKMSPEDLMYRMSITVDTADPEKVPELIEIEKERYKNSKPDLSSDELEKAYRQIEDVIKRQCGEKAFQTQMVMEAVARAASEGKIVVIDEFSYLPPETIASLNNISSTTPGESGQITVGDRVEKVEVKEGFGIIFTGNIGKEYTKGRQELDPAFINRILSGVIHYSYPPQEINGSLDDSIVDINQEEDVPSRDLFRIATTQLIDMKGNLEAPPDALDQLWRLTQAFSMVQQLTSGKDFRDLFPSSQGGIQDITKFNFKNISLSLRNLNQVVREWKIDGYSKPLDWYIYNNIILPASVLEEREAAQIHYIFKWAGFFEGQEWSPLVSNSTSWTLSGTDQISREDLYYEEKRKRIFSSQEVVEAISGEKMPSYREMDTEIMEGEKERRDKELLIAEWERCIREERAKLKEYERYSEEICKERTQED